MKKPILLIALGLMALLANAAPALRGAFTVTQADGTRLTVEQFGDEHHHWTATADGSLVVNTERGYYVARINESGQLEATDILAHEPGQRDSSEEAAVRQQAQRLALFHEQGEQARRRALSIDESGYPYLPHHGQPRVLCILAEFQDVSFSVNEPAVAFNQMMNADHQEDLGNHNTQNIASVSQYFQTCSEGQFSPVFDVVGPIRLPHDMAYYGGSDANGSDDQFNLFCSDAIAKVNEDNLVSDWSRYDNDGNRQIELVCIIYAGYGQNQGGGNNTIWAKASYLNAKVDNDHRIAFFNCGCELFHPNENFQGWINGTGVFCHEFSHCLGLPDLYATTSAGYVNNQGMESWDLMDYGLYNNNGYAPALYTAWEQEVMGWTAIEPVSEAQELNSIYPLAEGGKAYKIVNSENDNDFIVLENIQQRGLNTAARGHGLLVYHVAYPYSTVNMGDRTNNSPGRPSVAVVPASGVLINSYLRGTGMPYTNNQWKEAVAASTFPGTQGITTLSDEQQLPNYHFYVYPNGTKSVNFTLNGIEEDISSGAISARLTTTSIQGLKADAPDYSSKAFTLDGRQQTSPYKGVIIQNGKKLMVK